MTKTTKKESKLTKEQRRALDRQIKQKYLLIHEETHAMALAAVQSLMAVEGMGPDAAPIKLSGVTIVLHTPTSVDIVSRRRPLVDKNGTPNPGTVDDLVFWECADTHEEAADMIAASVSAPESRIDHDGEEVLAVELLADSPHKIDLQIALHRTEMVALGSVARTYLQHAGLSGDEQAAIVSPAGIYPIPSAA